MASARRLAASLAFAGALLALLFPFSPAKAQGGCEEAAEVAILPSPYAPWKGAPLRVLVAGEHPVGGELTLIAPDGGVAAKSRGHIAGPPSVWFAEVATPAAGAWRAVLTLDSSVGGCSTVTKEIEVSATKPAGPPAAERGLWELRNSWNRETENLYSAWIAKLFDAPLEAEPSWKNWSDVLRDRSRNMLFNHFGQDEDKAVSTVRPDCADFVYFLRAYFAYKMGLPFGYSNCSRGGGGSPPHCNEWFDMMHPESVRPARVQEASADAKPAAPRAAAAPSGDLLGQLFSPQQAQPAASDRPESAKPAQPKRQRVTGFGQFLRAVGDVVQSGSVRASGNGDRNDFYMIPLTQESLRPGTVYADPYGHVLMLAQRIPETSDAAGLFFAVDAEPDGSVTRKRFWRGNFLFVHDPSLGSPGFKRFRPVVRQPGGGLRALTNAEIAKNPDYGDFSQQQTQLGTEEFYDRMDEVMSPEPLDPTHAMEGAIRSLEEQVKTRATAVENGRKFQSSGKGEASMPDGAAIFQTNGAWEDFSTPARDLRLLIAIDVVRNYPDRVARHPERYAMSFGQSGASAKADLQRQLTAELANRKFTYTRSDGSSWTLTLKDVMDRAEELEMAYNPNDCVELRWGAPQGSAEAETCARHAPSGQRSKMSEYRSWFRERQWPHA